MKLKFKQALVVLIFIFPCTVWAHEVTAADQKILDGGGLLSYIYVGAKHMLTGYDHLLFLAGVVFYLTSFKDIVRFITFFTIGHCITLIGATYLGITANEHLVDAVIALSVFYKGFENLGGFKRLGIQSPNLLLMVLIFGLIHGFGLATRLQSFTIGDDQFLAKILSFNIGVEIGQIIALVPIVFIITQWRKKNSFQPFYKAANYYLVIAGIGLFVWQLYGYYYNLH